MSNVSSIESKKERKREYDKERHLRLREEKIQYNRKYYKNNKEKAQAATKRWESANKERVALKKREWRRNNQGRIRGYALKRKYGISRDDYERILESQDYTCGICGRDDPQGKHEVFFIDHCHDSGKVRGLLCNSCNLGLGKFEDDPERLKAAANYLEKYKET